MAMMKSSQSTAASIWERLVTEEDPIHIHKTWGILCLASFIWRFSMAGPMDMGFRSYPQWTPPTLALHFSLNATSFLFHIPARRIKSGGYRIWPEYRWHSFIFLCRSLLYILLVWYRDHQRDYNKKNDIYYYFAHYMLVMLSCGAADIASYSQSTAKSPTIRGFDVPCGIKYFFSSVQLLATTNTMSGFRRHSTQFIFCWIIQVNAFLMTLQRKNIGSHQVLLFVYGMTLIVGIIFTSYEGNFMAPYYRVLGVSNVGLTAILLRLGPRWLPWPLHILQNNKYIMWTALFICDQCLVLPWVQFMKVQNNRGFWARFGGEAYWTITLVAVVVWGFYKPYLGDNNNKKDKGTKESINKLQ